MKLWYCLLLWLRQPSLVTKKPNVLPEANLLSLNKFASSLAESRCVVARVTLQQGLYAGQRLVARMAARNRGELMRLNERP